MTFQVKTRPRVPGGTDGVYILTCVGRLDTETAPLLEKEFKEVLGHAPRLVAFDMEGTSTISSAGVRILILAYKRMKEQGGKAVLVRVQPQVKKVLEIINAMPHQKIFKDTDELDAYLERIQRKILEPDNEW